MFCSSVFVVCFYLNVFFVFALFILAMCIVAKVARVPGLSWFDSVLSNVCVHSEINMTRANYAF